MSKYNNIKSIPIDSLSEDELKVAMKEWTEGDDAMEALLWALYHKGIKTSGCHAGSRPYIGMDFEEASKDDTAILMNAVLSVKDSQIMARPDGGNPFSGDDWYKPDVTVGFNTVYKDDADEKFDMMRRVINGEDDAISLFDMSPIHDLISFFINKYTGILIRIKHDNDDNYILSFECVAKKDSDKLKYFNDSLLGLGFTYSSIDEIDRYFWEFNTNDPQELNSIMRKAVDSLINNFSLKIPAEPEEADTFLAKAHIIRNRSVDEFYEWLAEEDKKSKAQWDEERKKKK